MSLLNLTYKPFEALSALYGGFLAPAMKIIVNDNLLSLVLSAANIVNPGVFSTDGISITLNKDTASSASFNLVGDYNLTTRSFTDKLSTGSKICILLGYGSVLKPVFVGYVDTVSYEFSGTPRITVQAFDAIKLMTASGVSERTWGDGKFYVDTIKTIMDDYSDICPLPIINIMPSLKKHGQLDQKSNSYDFVKNYLCKYCDRDLIVSNGYAYLTNPYQQFGRLTTLGFGSGLTSFSVHAGYKKIKAMVTGDKLSRAYAETTVMVGTSYKSSMNHPQEIKVSAPLKTSSDCMVYAKRLAKDAVREVQVAQGTCIGIPDIVPGVGIGVLGVDNRWNLKTYYVDTVTHSFSSSGYTTSFTTKGWN